MVRTISSVTPNKDMFVLYGANEAKPISIIVAKEKMKLEESKPDGLCVGKPLIKNSVKIIKVQDGRCGIIITIKVI